MSDDEKWNYHEMVDHAVGIISREVKRLGVKGEASLERALDRLRQLKKTNWRRPTASSLGNHIYVIRFKDAAKTQQRVFGHFFDGHASFVMTLLGYEKDDVYHPRDDESKAREHKTACDADFQGRTKAFPEYCEKCERDEGDELQAPRVAEGRKRVGKKGSLD